MLFLAYFPNSLESKGGFAHRIFQIDELFKNISRVYLYVSLRKYLIPQRTKKGTLKEYRLNIVYFPFIIYLILKAKLIYVHSIYNTRFIFPVLFMSKAKVFVELHGALPEEVLFTKNNLILFKVYSLLEMIIVKRANFLVSVSEALANHITQKWKINRHIFLIPMVTIGKIIDEFKLNTRKIDFIYVGGIHRWQCLNKVIQVLEMYPNKKAKVFLSDLNHIYKFPDYTDVSSIAPSEVSKYLLDSKLGFVIRDNHILNKVSCPTKLIEYMLYGVVPIVDFEDIGDFLNLGYMYVKYTDLIDGIVLDDDKICKIVQTNIDVIKKINILQQAGLAKLKLEIIHLLDLAK